MKVGKKLTEWDESNIECPEDMEWAWQEFIEDMDEYILKEIVKPTGFWRATVVNFGWANRDGYAIFKADNATDLLSRILPKTDCTFHVFRYGKGLAIRNWHHDSPTGNEWYYITPIAKSTYDRRPQ